MQVAQGVFVVLVGRHIESPWAAVLVRVLETRQRKVAYLNLIISLIHL